MRLSVRLRSKFSSLASHGRTTRRRLGITLRKPPAVGKAVLGRAHPDLNQGPADLQSAALTTELCTHMPIRTDRPLHCGTRALQCPIILECWQGQAGEHKAGLASKPLENPAMEFGPKQVWSSGYDVSLTR